MYLQSGDERQWLQQQRRTMELEAARRPANANASRRMTAELLEDFGDAVRTTARRAISLLRSSLASPGSHRPGTV